jgi:hypothetical protein
MFQGRYALTLTIRSDLRKIVSPLDYAREVLGRMPSFVRFDIVVAMAEQGVDVTELLKGRVDPVALPSPVLVEGEFDWAV